MGEFFGGLFVLGLLAAVASGPIALIVALLDRRQRRAEVRSLSQRIEALSRRLREVTSSDRSPGPADVATLRTAPPPAARPAPAADPSPPSSEEVTLEVEATTHRPADGGTHALAEPVEPPEPLRPPALSRRPALTERNVMILLLGLVGGFAFLVAVGFFLKYAAEQGLLGPRARVVMGTLAGFTLLALAEILRQRHRVVADVLGGTGVGTLYAAMWAGERIFAVIPFPLAFGIAAFAAIVAGVQAVRYRSRLIAWMGLGGAIAILLGFGSSASLGSFGLVWVLALAVGAGEVVRRTGWVDLLVFSLLGSVVLEARAMSTADEDPWIWAALVAAIHLSLISRAKLWQESRPLTSSIFGVGAAAVVAIFVGLFLAHPSLDLFLPVTGLVAVMTASIRLLVRDRAGLSASVALMIMGFSTSALLGFALLDSGSPFGPAASLALAAVALGVVIVAGLSGAFLTKGSPTLALYVAGAAAWVQLVAIQLELWRRLISADGAALIPLTHGFLAVGVLVLLRRRLAPLTLPLTGDQKTFLVQAALALGFLTAVLPVKFDQQHLVAALALEALALFFAASAWRSKELGWAALACLTWSFGRLLIASNEFGAQAGLTPVVNWRLYAFGLPVAVGLTTSHLLRPGSPFLGLQLDVLARAWRWTVAPMALVTTFVFLNVECSAWFLPGGAIGLGAHPATQGLVRSVVWMGFGFLLLVWGISRRNRPVRLSALLILILTAFKVFLSDVASLSSLYRVGSLVGLSVVLLSGAFLYSRFVSALEEDPS